MKHLAQALLALLLLATGTTIRAEPGEDACAALRSARIHLIALMGARNPATQDNHEQLLHAASNRLDALLAGMSHGQDAADVARAQAFLPVWEAFKNTRETEILPAVRSGRHDAARKTALDVQAGRMKQMKAAMGCK